ncbi:MAG: transposase [Chloroflexi bacterium]|nr:transposase [Chloroflexota bacterium]
MKHFDLLDPPRCRANKRRGRGTFANDRPPVLGIIGHHSGQVRLRVVEDTKQTTMRAWWHFTREGYLSTPMSTTATTPLTDLA